MRLSVHQREIGDARIILVHLGDGRLKGLSLHFAPRTAFLLLRRAAVESETGELDLASEALRADGRPAAADLLHRAAGSYMSAHSCGVRRLAVSIGRELGLDSLELRWLAHAATLHDVGKMLVPAAILAKPRALTPSERVAVQRHSQRGAEILTVLGFPGSLVRAVAAHHERMDGAGYPAGLKGATIPLAARIIAVADAYDVMVHPRSYARARSTREAIAELERCAPDQFDSICVDALRSVENLAVRAPSLFALRPLTPSAPRRFDPTPAFTDPLLFRAAHGTAAEWAQVRAAS